MSKGPEVGELSQVPVPYLICPQLQSLLPESLARSLLPGTEYQKQLLAAQVQLQSGTAELQAELLQSQARLADLEAQVRGRGQLAVMGRCHCEGWKASSGSPSSTLSPLLSSRYGSWS